MLWRWRRNPLCRASDRLEAWVTLLFVLACSLGLPAAGIVTALAVQKTIAAERVDRYPAPAVLLQDAPVVPASSWEGAGTRVTVTVRWTSRDGAAHIGTAAVPRGGAVGSATRVWVDHAARLTVPPPTPAEGATLAVLSGSGAAAVAGSLLLLVRALVRERLDRLRMREWERAWAETGPRWTRGHA